MFGIIGFFLSAFSVLLGVISIILSIKNRNEIKNIKIDKSKNIQQAGFVDCTDVNNCNAIIKG